MNRRERILLVVVIAVVVLFAGKGLFNAYTSRMDDLDASIRGEKRRLSEYDDEIARAVEERRLWADAVADTLSRDPAETRMLLVGQVDALVRRHGLLQPAVRPTAGRTDKEGIGEQSFSVDGIGTLSQIIAFLYDFYNLPFLARTDSIKLVPQAGQLQGKLKLTIKGETIVLPTHPFASETRTADLQADAPKVAPRTAHDEAGPYLALADRKLFEPWTPPPPPPPPPTRKPPTPTVKEAPPPPPHVEPRDPARNSTRITSLLGTPDAQEVVLTGGDAIRRIVQRGQILDGGVLILVHPTGAVVMYKNEPVFYEVGKLLSESTPLTEDEHPEVYDIFKRMEKASGTDKDATADSRG